MHTAHRRIFTILATALVGVIMLFTGVYASHSWGNYHWARRANPFTLKLGNNVSSAWNTYLVTASSDWTASTVLNTTVVTGGTRPKNCRPTSGRVEVCNARYGNNGWLGLAQIWVSGSHITQAVTKMNDTYFETATYNTPAWRRFVMCQEVGHTFGLDHQDENFNNGNLGSCMDYTRDPDGPPSNEHPDDHDYAQLEKIYLHLDSTTTVGQLVTTHPQAMNEIQMDTRAQWGRLIRSTNGGRTELYVADFGADPAGERHRVFTFVIWAVDDGPRGNR